MTRKSIGVRLDGSETFAEALHLAQLAENADATSLWITQHLGKRDALTLASALAARTSSITVVPSNISPFMAHPMPTAMALATVNEIAPHRIAVAIGIGNQLDLKQSGAIPFKSEAAIADFTKGLGALFAGKPVELQGTTFSLSGAKLSTPSAIPIYLTALGPEVAQEAGKLADGVQLSAGFSAAFAGQCVSAFADGARSVGRNPQELRTACFAYFGTDADSSFEDIRRKLGFLFRNKLMSDNIKSSGIEIDQAAIIDAVGRSDLDAAAALVPDAAVEAFSIIGKHDDCVAKARQFFDAGVDELLINFGSTPHEREAALHLIRSVNG